MLSGVTVPTLLGNTAPLWVGLGALFLFREKLKRSFWWGVLLALLGVLLIVGLPEEFSAEFQWGILAAGGTACFGQRTPGIRCRRGEGILFKQVLGDIEAEPGSNPEVTVEMENVVGGGVALEGAFVIMAAVGIGLGEQKIGEAPHPARVFVVDR